MRHPAPPLLPVFPAGEKERIWPLCPLCRWRHDQWLQPSSGITDRMTSGCNSTAASAAGLDRSIASAATRSSAGLCQRSADVPVPRSLVRSHPCRDIIVRVSSCQRYSGYGVFCTCRGAATATILPDLPISADTICHGWACTRREPPWHARIDWA